MLPLRYLRDTAVFAPSYIALDWASYIDPLGPFNITPWNPQSAVAIVWMLLGGPVQVPLLFTTIFAADVLVRDVPGGYLITLLSAAILAGGYAWIAWVLRAMLPTLTLRSSRELTLFVFIVLGGTAIIGAAFIGLLRGADLLYGTPVISAWLRFWIGDAVGVLVTAPLFLAAADPGRRSALATLARRPETLLHLAVLAGTIWLIFFGLEGNPGHRFYAFFVPLIWITARAGMNGAIVASAIVQLGVVLGIHAHGAPAFPVLEIQALVATLTLTGLYLGMMVDERTRAAQALRQTLRLAAAGDMAGALAHELNQPLTALANYGESARMLLGRGEDREALADIIVRMQGEARRAADVVRRLRDFFRSGTTRLETVQAADLLAAVRRIAEQVIGPRSIRLEVHATDALPALYVDRVQIELVIRNLVVNALEAQNDLVPKDKRIRVSVQPRGAEQVEIIFRDSGPGLKGEMTERVFEPFVSGKPTGMGLGLAISRAIAEAHGGSLEARSAAHGEFHLVLPCTPAR